MDEAFARAWTEAEFGVPRETMARLDAFVALLRAENDRQNLVARSTLERPWHRHIMDSAQLLRFSTCAGTPERWIDLGSGAGFPGLVIAALRPGPTALVEERKLRVDFLHIAAALLGVEDRTEIIAQRAERVQPRGFEVITARAFAPLMRLFELGSHFSTDKTRWILPKGRNARSELEAARSSWQGDFRIEPSLTDPDAGIIVAEGVKRKRG